MSDDEVTPDGWEYAEGPETAGETLARTMGNIARCAEEDGSEVLGLVVVALLSTPDGKGETITVDSSGGLGYARKRGMLEWAVDVAAGPDT